MSSKLNSGFKTEHPLTTVAAIVTRNKSEVLLVLRNTNPYKGYWCLPGGFIDQNEFAQDAVIREVKEETGLNFFPTFTFYFDEIIPEKQIHSVVLVFNGKGVGQFSFNPDEISDVKWFPLNEAQNMQLAFLHNNILDKYVHSISKPKKV